MTKAQALKLARAKWGDVAHVKHNPKALTRPERLAASAELQTWRARRSEQTTPDDMREWRRQVDRLTLAGTTEPCYVGFRSALAFHVRGSGDTWEEACRKAGLL